VFSFSSISTVKNQIGHSGLKYQYWGPMVAREGTERHHVENASFSVSAVRQKRKSHGKDTCGVADCWKGQFSCPWPLGGEACEATDECTVERVLCICMLSLCSQNQWLCLEAQLGSNQCNFPSPTDFV
jgi:hypothetical protein